MTQMITLKIIEKKLQRANGKHSRLYVFCNFIALMIISAYSVLAFSKTVQATFPEGGDSRKQMYAIFVMTLVGCVVFTIYAAGLFFRHKSGQLGIMMAMGASRKRLLPGLFREVFLLSSLSAGAGIAAGFPFAFSIWGLFRLILVDSSDMVLNPDLRCLFISLFFFLLVVGCACIMAWRYLKRTNIMETIREEHINEPVKELGRWCGPVGFVLILAGAAMGYFAPVIWMEIFHTYSVEWLNILYAPVFAGLYMVMLYTVVYGWGNRKHKKNPYHNVISRGMMKFQAKQTVNNMLVVTILIAGGAFAMFYLPMSGLSAVLRYINYSNDYFYQYRADQKIPKERTVRELAEEYGLTLKDWGECEYIVLGTDGTVIIEDGGTKFHYEYLPVAGQGRILSEDAYYELSGQKTDVLPGTYRFVTNADETSVWKDDDMTNLTNMITRQSLDMEFAGYLHYDLLANEIGYYVLDRADYDRMSEELTDEWKGYIAQFNVDGKDSYQFANTFYHSFVNSFDESCESNISYDPVARIVANESGETYWMDTEKGDEFRVCYDDADTMNFRMQWAYSPSFRILLLNDHLKLMGVLYMMFLFIFIVCLTTALVICHTRCQTIVLNNRYLYDDLRKLGASPVFLSREVCRQCGNVFKVPFFVGVSAMYLLFTCILYVNDGKISYYETIGLLVSLAILLLIGGIVYGVYRGTVRMVMRQLGIR